MRTYRDAYDGTNKRLYNQAENTLRRIRQSPKLYADDTTKIDRVLLKAKARMIRRMHLPCARVWPERPDAYLYSWA